jgi:glycosyltransferase involved in cell wall biosynthesis
LRHEAGPLRTALRIVRSIATGIPFANLKYTPPELRTAVAEMCASGTYDLVLAEHQHVADDVLAATQSRVVVDMHNVYSELYARMARSSLIGLKAVHSRLQAPLAFRQERRLERAFALLTVSPEDSASLMRGGTSRPCFVVPNGVDVDHFRRGGPAWAAPRPAVEASPLIVMTGSMDYFPNKDGAIHLVRGVMPLVWRHVPDARVAIVGRDPGREVRQLASDSRVTVTGRVPDVRPYLEAADVAVVPLRSGSGSRLKALEAAAMSAAIVGTPVGLEGIPFTHGSDALISSTPSGLAESIVSVIGDRAFADALGTNARRLIEDRFSWESCRSALDVALTTLTASPATLGKAQ